MLDKVYYNYLRTWLQLKTKNIRSRYSKQHKSYTKFIILCSPRTGSTLLHTYLSSHPNIISQGEVLRRSLEENNALQIPYSESRGTNIQAVGLKLFYDYFHVDSYEQILRLLSSDATILIIHLTRIGLDAQYRSLKKAEYTGIWNDHTQSNHQYTPSYNEKELDTFIKKLNANRELTLTHFTEHQILNVTYEQLMKDTDQVLTNIQLFLSVSPRKLSTLLKKQSGNVG